MTIQETIQLLNAGYSKADIDAMVSAQQAVVQQPTIQQPVVQQPTIQQPVVQQPTIQQPVVQQPTIQQPVVQQPVVQQPTVQQPVVQQPTVQQPVVQQPTVPQPVTLTQQQLQQLIQGVAVQTASGVVETPPSANDILANMFNEITGETNKED